MEMIELFVRDGPSAYFTGKGCGWNYLDLFNIGFFALSSYQRFQYTGCVRSGRT